MTTLSRSSVIAHRQVSRWLLPRSTATISIRHHSTSSAETDATGIGNVNVDNLISGVTTEMAKKDPKIAEFLRANYPEKFETEEDQAERPVTNWGERRRTAPKAPLNIRPLATVKRCPETEEGSNRCFPLREQGYVPGVLYGGDPTQGIHGHDFNHRIFVKTLASTVQSEIDRYHHTCFGSRVYDLTVYETVEQMEAQEGGVVHRVMPRDIQVHPVNDLPYCVNFLRYFPGRPIKIPLKLINEEESPALKRDGFLIPINRFMECRVDEGVEIPEQLEVECTGLQFKQVVRMDRIIFPDGVRPSKKILKANDWMVGPIHGGKGGVDEDAVAAAEAEEKAEE